MFKLFYLFQFKRLLPGSKKQTIFNSKFSVFNSIKFKPPKMVMLNFFSILFLLFSASCCTTEPQLEPKLTLELKDISCIEAWLQFSSTNFQIPNNISLLINGTVVKTFNINTQDSLFYIDSLLPNQTYKLKVASIQNLVSSNELTVSTMDTTSHNFTWQTFEFGIQTNISRLFDVAIINENNIWAVGQIFMNDSLGNPDPNSYNAVHWDGTNWELKKIGSYGGWACRTVFAFSENDVWFEGTIKWDGVNYSVHSNGFPLEPNGDGWQINKMWGSSSNDLYAVGNNGNIAHYNGSSWKKIESGTNLILSDIAVNNNSEINICGLNIATVDGIIIKSNDGENFNTLIESDNIPPAQLFKPKLYGTVSSICFAQTNTLHAAGNLVYQYKFNQWDYVKSLPENFIGGNPGTYYRGYVDKIRATAPNDIWISGDRNTLRHFNGRTWQQIGMPYDPQVDLVWRGMETKNNITMVVGSHDSKAIIMVIR